MARERQVAAVIQMIGFISTHNLLFIFHIQGKMFLCSADNLIWAIMRRLKRFSNCITADKHMTLRNKIWVNLEGAVGVRTRRDCSKTTNYSLAVLYILRRSRNSGIGS